MASGVAHPERDRIRKDGNIEAKEGNPNVTH